MKRSLVAIEIAGFVALLAGVALVAYGVWQFSAPAGAIVAGVAVFLIGASLIALTNPELSRRRDG